MQIELGTMCGPVMAALAIIGIFAAATAGAIVGRCFGAWRGFIEAYAYSLETYIRRNRK